MKDVLWTFVSLMLLSTAMVGLPTVFATESPTLEVQPSSVLKHELGETFEVNIAVMDLDATLNVIGVQFALVYDADILEFVGYENGTLMEAFVNDGEQGVLYTEDHDFLEDPTLELGQNKVFFITMILPDTDGAWHEPYPSGNGTLCTITFEVITEPPASSTLELVETMLLDTELNEITHGVEDGSFELVAWLPAEFTVSNLSISPTEVNVKKAATVTVTVSNTGELSGTYTATLKVDGVVEDTEDVTVESGGSKTASFTVTKETKGTYSIDIDGLTGTLTVKKPPPYGLYAGIIIVLILIVVIVWYTRKS